MSTSTTIIEAIRNKLYTDKVFADHIDQYLNDPNPSLVSKVTLSSNEWGYPYLASHLIESFSNAPSLIDIIRFFVELSNHGSSPEAHKPLLGVFSYYTSDEYSPSTDLSAVVASTIAESHKDLASITLRFFENASSYNRRFPLAHTSDQTHPFQDPVANLLWENIDSIFVRKVKVAADHNYLFEAATRYRPQMVAQWIAKTAGNPSWDVRNAWFKIIDSTTNFDQQCLEHCQATKAKEHDVAFSILSYLNTQRKDAYLKQTLELARLPGAIQDPDAVELGLKHFPDELLLLFAKAMQEPGSDQYLPGFMIAPYRKLFKFAADNWKKDGETFFRALSTNVAIHQFSSLLEEKAFPSQQKQHPFLRDLFTYRTEHCNSEEISYLWQLASTHYPAVFTETFLELLHSKSKRIRESAATGLAKAPPANLLTVAADLLEAKKVDSRLGAIQLLARLGEQAIPHLRNALPNEKSSKVRNFIEQTLGEMGASAIETDTSPDQLLDQIEQDKRIRLPKTPWLDLPAIQLITKDGTPLTEKALTYIIQKQSKHKTIEASPSIAPVLELLDDKKNADSALALLNQFLDSGQEAKDRWALTLAGLLGDNRVILALEPRIDPWCKESRHKLAEYAAQAISLLASEEALMVLDSLKNRYSRKYKNIGRACGEAFNAAAQARGISTDELADMIVPDLGFNQESQRPLEAADTSIIANLTNDFKLTWYNPDTGKEAKAPPSNLSAEAKEEIADLRKLIRTVVKAQNLRLEQSLVTQRRWSVRRWQELFEQQPLLKPYASNLVWGVYTPDNALLRTFRRYENGILATGSGDMEDLEENDTTIGIIHPLELSEEQKAAWLDHFGRFKIKPPFPQLERPIELLDPAHGNRSQITFTENITMSVGTFRSRAEKRLWTRGSVIDAGGVTSQWKSFPEAGVEAFILTEDYWVGQDPMDTITLGIALFAKAGSIDRGSYEYDDPTPDDPRLLPFSEVSPIVYSEVITDLKAIIDGQT